jgi:hypothetical protein
MYLELIQIKGFSLFSNEPLFVKTFKLNIEFIAIN